MLHSVHIHHPIRAVSAALARGFREWFPDLDGASPPAGGQRVVEIGIQKKLSVEFGEPVAAGSWTEVPISWKAASVHELFPIMTGKVEVAPVDGRNTQLTVCGTYQPPLDRLGKYLDDALMHKVAEATVKDLAESLALGIETLVRSDG